MSDTDKIIEEALELHGTDLYDDPFEHFKAGYQAALTHKSDEIADKARLHMSLSRSHPVEKKLEIAIEALEEIRTAAIDLTIEHMAEGALDKIRGEE